MFINPVFLPGERKRERGAFRGCLCFGRGRVDDGQAVDGPYSRQACDPDLAEAALRIVLQHNLSIATITNVPLVCREWRDATALARPRAHLVFYQVGQFSFKRQLAAFRRVVESPRYAEGGPRPLGALALSLGSPRSYNMQGDTQPDNGPGWQIARLSAVADLLENLPGSCTVLALNGGAAESLVGLHELARVGLASVRRRDSMSTGISKRLPLLHRLSALRLERLPPTQSAASAALWGYLSLAGCAGGDSQLTRLEVSRPHRCCGHDCGDWQQVHDSSLLARALPLFRGLADLTLDERNFTDTTGELRDLLSALQPNAAPALAHLRCRRSKVRIYEDSAGLFQALVNRLVTLDLEDTVVQSGGGRLTLGGALRMKTLVVNTSRAWSWADGLPPNIEVLGIKWQEWAVIPPLALPPSLRWLALSDGIDFDADWLRPHSALQVLLSLSCGRLLETSDEISRLAPLLPHVTELRAYGGRPNIMAWEGVSMPCLRRVLLQGAAAGAAAGGPHDGPPAFFGQLRSLDLSVPPGSEHPLDLSGCTALTWLRWAGDKAAPFLVQLPALPIAILPPSILSLSLAHLQVGDSSALALWLVQLSRLQVLQLAGCMLASPRGYQWLLPGSGLPNSLLEVRLLLWPPPPPRFDATGVEDYGHLTALPRLQRLTVWPPPPRLATSDFWPMASELQRSKRVTLNTTGNFLPPL